MLFPAPTSVPFLFRPFVVLIKKGFLASIGKGYPFRQSARLRPTAYRTDFACTLTGLPVGADPWEVSQTL